MYPKFKIIVATTSIINGNNAIEQLSGPTAEDSGLLLGDLLKSK
jgi:hypothetical protein